MADQQTEQRRRKWWRIDGERLLLNSEAAARFFGVTSRTLLDWVDHGCPKEERGWYDPAAILRWRGEVDDPEAGDGLNNRKLRAETAYREAKAKQAELEYDAQRGLYFEKSLVESEWAKRILELKAGLAALARTVAKHFTDPAVKAEVERVIGDEVYKMLDQYAREGAYTPQNHSHKKAGAKRSKTTPAGNRQSSPG